MKINFKTLGMIAAGAVIAGGIASCSDSSEEPQASADGAISFGAVVPKSSRAESTTTTSINSFIVYAFTNGKPYMEGVKVTRSGAKWGYSPVAYWPSTPVNFYAYSPDISNSPSMGPSTDGQIPDYSNTGSTDLLYAVNMGETAKASPVLMNFRHALSRVDVLLSSQNPDITVKVAHVSLNEVDFRGTFTFPQATTSVTLPQNVGSWSDLKQPTNILTYYAFEESDFTTLTSTPVNLTEGNLEMSFMLPQPLEELEANGTGYTGNAIQVDCEIFDTATGAKIWPNAATPSTQLVSESQCGKLMFPVTTQTVKEWKIGHAYVYNIQIDNPTVLHPIYFNVTVDEFTLEPTD